MNEKKKKIWLTIAVILLVQYIPAVILSYGKYLTTGEMLTAVEMGLGAIATGIIYIPILKSEKLKSRVFPKVLKILSILNVVCGCLYVILGITLFR